MSSNPRDSLGFVPTATSPNGLHEQHEGGGRTKKINTSEQLRNTFSLDCVVSPNMACAHVSVYHYRYKMSIVFFFWKNCFFVHTASL